MIVVFIDNTNFFTNRETFEEKIKQITLKYVEIHKVTRRYEKYDKKLFLLVIEIE